MILDYRDRQIDNSIGPEYPAPVPVCLLAVIVVLLNSHFIPVAD